MEKRDKKCEERIEEELKSRLDDLIPELKEMEIKKLQELAKIEGIEWEDLEECELISKIRESIQEAHQQRLLGLSKIMVYDLCLSTGGPEDHFELRWDVQGKYWDGGHYVFKDWWDGARRAISAETAEKIAEVYGICPDDE